MPDIIQLPPGVINKIAAGEVIERPASVIKELMENSVDAGASRVDVAIEKGGTEMLRVADNGCGIATAQLPLAIATHATSKIRDADDLFRVSTLGFRGEALASISEVSQLTIRSRPANVEVGSEMEIHGGSAGEVVPAGCPQGTTIEVRQLFFNTPVRRRFLRTTQTEMGHVVESFTRISLVHPEIHFTLRHGDRVIHDLPPVESWKERIIAFFGREMQDVLIRVDSQEDYGHLHGYVADPVVSRSNNRMQYLFLNGRHIRDRSLQHALGESYRGLLLTGRCPVAFLRLDVPVEQVDVNVHPTKLEVRFQDAGKLYSQVLGSIRNRFLTTDLTATVRSPDDQEEAPVRSESSGVGDVRFEREHEARMVRWARGQSDAGAPREPRDLSGAQRQSRFEVDYVSGAGESPAFRPFGAAGSERQAGVSTGEAPETTAPHSGETNTVTRRGLQLHNRYLVTENEQGMIVIDQHALHERVLYEHLREKVLAGQLETQRLLVPEPVTLTPTEASLVLDAADMLSKLGIRVEPFGGDTVAVTSFPAMLAKVNPADMLRRVVEQLEAGGKQPDRRDVLDELLHLMSCKAAVKAGDRLSAEEIDALLDQRELCQDSHHCPHGRPTALIFTREELDRRFLRI